MTKKRTFQVGVKNYTEDTKDFNRSGITMPHSDEIEVKVLGAMLLTEEAAKQVIERLEAPDWKTTICLSGKTSDAFYNEKHKFIYEALVLMRSYGIRIDIVSLTEQLKKLGTLEKAGGCYYISEISIKVPTYAYLQNHINLLLEYQIRRSLLLLSKQIASKSLNEDDVDALELLLGTLNDIQSIIRAITTSKELAGKELIIKMLERLEKIRDGKVVNTGFNDFDKIVGGFLAGNYVLIGARPGVGKTALALSMAINMIAVGKRVCFFSLEMNEVEIGLRLTSIYTNIPLWKLRTDPNIDKTEKVQEFMQWLESKFIFDDSIIDDFTIQSKIKHYKEKYNIDCAFIDYIGLMQCSVRTSTESERLERISRAIKQTAKANEIPIIVLSQLNREITRRKDGIPCMADLRSSGAMEQDADIIVFPFRPSENVNGIETMGSKTILIVDKHRHGRTGFIENSVRFIKHLAKFENIENESITSKIEQEDIDF